MFHELPIVSPRLPSEWAAVRAATELVKPPFDPRTNPFDWETWHELDVFREEAEAKLKDR